MSEPRLIAPLLADFVMGDPISAHHGVRCCPAMRKGSDEKYIVKIISVPASQVQLDALLITGAYRSRESALAYFRELSDAAVQEAELLQRLSRVEGFTAYEGWQIVPMDGETGFDVYLLGAYRPTLERMFRRSPLTQLGAVNLGLDLCAALSVCRRSGYLYADLKPGNIFVTENNEYRIGDLGFIPLDSLKYASLPDKYRSAYTAPEITDAYSSLNTTMDIYAAGLILYQTYNNGELPIREEGSSEPLPPPAYADYEMAEIILKACAVHPEERWQDPAQMGQALVNYMQRNSVNDIPIIPSPAPEAPVPVEEPPAEEPEDAGDAPEGTVEEAEPSGDVPADAGEVPEETDPIPDEPQEETPDTDAPEADTPSDDDAPEADAPAEDDAEQIAIAGFLTDETEPTDENTGELPDTLVSEEVSAMLAMADELIAHKTPDPVVAPEPIEVPIPPRIQPEPEEPASPGEPAPEDEPEPAKEPEPAETGEAPEPEEPPAAVAVKTEEPTQSAPAPKPRKKHGGLIAFLSVVLILLLLAVGAYHFYENYYLQPILGIRLAGDENYLTVTLDTEIDNSLLTVCCTDTYGNKLPQPVVNNSATFTSLNPGTSYRITVEISGFHRLIGTVSESYTTASQTNIVSFTAVTGDQDGSVILNFSVQGPDNTTWKVKYSAPGVEEKTENCTGHMANISGLEVGSKYTFTLVPEADLYVVGTQTLEYTASKVILPRNLAIQGFRNGELLVSWEAPEGSSVENWTVRCYNNGEFDTTVTVTDTAAAISDLDPAQGYTVEVKAEGMTVCERAVISANSVTFKELLLDDSAPGSLVVTWNYEGTAPESGWRLFYTIDGGEKYVVPSDTNTCTISPLIPGAHYSISFDLPGDITVLGGTKEYDAPEAPAFSGYGVAAGDFTARMCRTPGDADWQWYRLYETDFATKFAPGEKASFVILLSKAPGQSDDSVPTLFVIRDANGKPVGVYNGRERSWSAMWSRHNGTYATELDLPSIPQNPGSYTVEIYFGGALVTTQAFTVA